MYDVNKSKLQRLWTNLMVSEKKSVIGNGEESYCED